MTAADRRHALPTSTDLLRPVPRRRAGSSARSTASRFDLQPGERLGLVGESGSGKSTIALALLRMIKPPGRIAGGCDPPRRRGSDIAALPRRQMRPVRLGADRADSAGRDELAQPGARGSATSSSTACAPTAAADGRDDGAADRGAAGARSGCAGTSPTTLPARALRRHEAARLHRDGDRRSSRRSSSPTSRPARSTSSCSARSWRRSAGCRSEIGAAVILIGHDMGLMAQFVDRLGVMYGGKLVEVGPTRAALRRAAPPLHAGADRRACPRSTRRRPSSRFRACRTRRSRPPSGCVFHPRCPKAFDACPVDRAGPAGGVDRAARVACHLYEIVDRSREAWKPLDDRRCLRRATSPRSSAAARGRRSRSPTSRSAIDEGTPTITASPARAAAARARWPGCSSASIDPTRGRGALSGQGPAARSPRRSGETSGARCRRSSRTRSGSTTRSTGSTTC